jgi:hypothetical protein
MRIDGGDVTAELIFCGAAHTDHDRRYIGRGRLDLARASTMSDRWSWHHTTETQSRFWSSWTKRTRGGSKPTRQFAS